MYMHSLEPENMEEKKEKERELEERECLRGEGA